MLVRLEHRKVAGVVTDASEDYVFALNDTEIEAEPLSKLIIGLLLTRADIDDLE